MRSVTLPTLTSISTSSPVALDWDDQNEMPIITIMYSSGAVATATLQYTVDDIFYPGWTPETGNWVDAPNLTNVTGTTTAAIQTQPAAIRLKLTAHTTGAINARAKQGDMVAFELGGGEPGAPGTDGSDGKTIHSGTIAPTNDIGVDGDHFVKTTDPVTWYGPKTGGAWPVGVSLKGSQGIPGTNGSVGNSVLSGSDAPVNGLGTNGDFYIQLSSPKMVYGPKAGGVWPGGVSMEGTAGTPGTPGTNGVDGNTVLYGTSEPANGNGANGNFYIRTDTWQIYGPKAGGVWPAGSSIIGPPGPQGVHGKTILSTSGAPSNGLGDDGDFALDVTASMIYGPKASGSWPAGVSIKGVQGEPGAGGAGTPTMDADITKGFWFDPSDLTTMFQDVNGRTPVTAAGQPVRLILDKSKGLVRGSDIVVNGTFTTDTNWTKAANWTISGGVAVSNGSSGTIQAAVQPLVAGTWYEATFTIVTRTAGSVSFPYDGTGAVNAPTVPGTYTYIFLADRPPLFLNSTSFNGSIDNVIVKPLLGNHAYSSVGTTLQQDGNGKYYLAFDGTDDVLDIDTNTILDDTINVFAALQYDSTGTTNMKVLSKWDDTNEGFSFGPDITNSQFSRLIVKAAGEPDLSSSSIANYSVLKRMDRIASSSVSWKLRTYDFNGTTPFRNATLAESDMADMYYNGTYKFSTQIVDAGFTPWIVKEVDASIGEQVTKITVQPGDSAPDGHRSQCDSYPIELYKDYCYDLELKLDPAWNFNMTNGDGLFLQCKGAPKTGQYGHAAWAIGLDNSNLTFTLLYPNNGENATTWPTEVLWGSSDYVSQTFTPQTMTAGAYHSFRLKFFLDDRPIKFGGKGYMKIWYNGTLWVDHTGPNVHPDQNPLAQNGEHRIDFGWYNWEGAPSANRVVYFRKAQLMVPTPKDKYAVATVGGAANTNLVAAVRWNRAYDQKMCADVNTYKSKFVDGPVATINRNTTVLRIGRDSTGRFFKGRLYGLIGVGHYLPESVREDIVDYLAYKSDVTL